MTFDFASLPMPPRPAAPASPAPQRCITVVLTDHVAGIEFLPLRHPDRLRVVWNRPLGRVVRAVLGRIGRAPGDLQAALWGDDPALFGAVSGEAAPRPMAVFWDGATVEGLTVALVDLAAAGWTPPAPIAAPDTDPLTPAKAGANPFATTHPTGARP